MAFFVLGIMAALGTGLRAPLPILLSGASLFAVGCVCMAKKKQLIKWGGFTAHLGVAIGLFAIVAYVIYRLMRPKLKDEGKEQKTEQDYAKEELDRILQPVEDESVAKEISDYRQNDDEEEIEENADKKEDK